MSFAQLQKKCQYHIWAATETEACVWGFVRIQLWVRGKAGWVGPAASSGCCQNCWFVQALYREICALLTFSWSLCLVKAGKCCSKLCAVVCEHLPELRREAGQERTWHCVSHVWTSIPLFSLPLSLQTFPPNFPSSSTRSLKPVWVNLVC